MRPSYLFYVFAFITLFYAGQTLAASLGSRTVPFYLRPIADQWIRSGRDQEWIRLLMWILFLICVVTFVVLLLYLTYPSIVDLGQRWPG